MIRMLHLILLALLLPSPGCGGCDGEEQDMLLDGGLRDAATDGDATAPDASGDAEAGAGDLADAGEDAQPPQDSDMGPDTGVKACEPSCQALGLELCVRDSQGDCVECVTSADCKANPTALGPVCDAKTNYCTCATNADCAKNPWGNECSTVDEMCGCTKATHCGPATFGAKCNTNLEACTCSANTDCAKNQLGKLCDTTDNDACYCMGNTDCPSGKTCSGNVGGGTWTYCK